MRAVALLVLSLSAAARAYSHLHDGTHTHRLVKRTAADTAGAVVGVLLFFLFVGFCWIMCQHPQWNPCGDCQCCCCCCRRPRPPHPAVAFLQLGPAHWLYVTSRGRWGTKAERPPDLEMQALGDDFVQQHRAPSYEAREMRVPTPAPSSHRSSPSPPPPPAARIHRDRLQVPERAARSHSHSRTRSEAAERRAPPLAEPAHERTLSDPTDRAFADIFGEGEPRPAPPPLTRGREKAIDRWRRTVAGE